MSTVIPFPHVYHVHRHSSVGLISLLLFSLYLCLDILPSPHLLFSCFYSSSFLLLMLLVITSYIALMTPRFARQPRLRLLSYLGISGVYMPKLFHSSSSERLHQFNSEKVKETFQAQKKGGPVFSRGIENSKKDFLEMGSCICNTVQLLLCATLSSFQIVSLYYCLIEVLIKISETACRCGSVVDY